MKEKGEMQPSSSTEGPQVKKLNERWCKHSSATVMKQLPWFKDEAPIQSSRFMTESFKKEQTWLAVAVAA